MTYSQVTVVVDGAFESEVIFHDLTLESDYIAEQWTTPEGMTHEHDDDVDCECIQYETDHHPKVTINSDREGTWQTS